MWLLVAHCKPNHELQTSGCGDYIVQCKVLLVVYIHAYGGVGYYSFAPSTFHVSIFESGSAEHVSISESFTHAYTSPLFWSSTFSR